MNYSGSEKRVLGVCLCFKSAIIDMFFIFNSCWTVCVTHYQSLKVISWSFWSIFTRLLSNFTNNSLFYETQRRSYSLLVALNVEFSVTYSKSFRFSILSIQSAIVDLVEKKNSNRFKCNLSKIHPKKMYTNTYMLKASSHFGIRITEFATGLSSQCKLM